MLSIGKLGQGQADYYLQAVGQGIEDYYTGAGEAPGRWLGSAAADVGISGEVEADALHAALNGNNPTTGDQLARPSKSHVRVPGFDLTFSAPKSVSVLFGLGDPAVSREVREAHEAAVEAALGYMERHAAVARRGRGGTQSVLGNGFLAAGFRHRTSRAGDPQLHTHVLVANMTRGSDGRWSALDARRLYVHAKTGGYLYQAHLRSELTRRLGVEWSPIHRGVADVAGIPQRILRAFSRRRAEIEHQMTQRGERSPRAAQVAALDTRQAKDYDVAPETLVERWRTQAVALDFQPRHISHLTGRAQPRRRSPADDRFIHDQLAGAEGLTRQRSTFVRRDVIQAWCQQLPQGAPIPEVESLSDEFMGSDRAVPLAADVRELTAADVIRRTDGRFVPATAEERPHSTPELLQLERALIDGALKRKGERTGLASRERVDAALAARPTLSGEQASMIRHLTCDGAGVVVVVGKAGAGKTFALDGAREAWERDGYRVIGAALARRAACELQDGSGIEATSVAALLQDLREGDAYALPRGGRAVLVVDEAGMVGTRQLAELLDHAAAAKAKVVLVGDDHQLPEIDAGGAFHGLLRRLAPIELTENRRQEHRWEHTALDLLRTGRAAEAIARYREQERVVVCDTATGAHGQLVSDWWAASQAGDQSVMIAARRDDVDELNAQARALMAASGHLGTEELEIAARRFAVGDHVVALSNARRFGVLNGTRGTITNLDLDARLLTLQTPDGRRIALPASYIDARTARGGPTLDHGYAITGHKSQGMTTGRAFVLGTEDLYREWGYVALSRGRIDNRLYVVAPEPRQREDYAPAQPRREPLQVLTDALSRTRAQHMATDIELELALATLPHADLIRELNDLEARHASGGLLARRSRLERQLAEVTKRRLAAETHAQKTPDDTRLPADDTPHSHARRAHAEDRTRTLAQQERELREQLAHLKDQAPADHHAESRIAALQTELDRRTDAAVQQAIAQPPPYLTALVGQCPDRPSQRRPWYRAVRHTETYRTRYAVRDPQRALGSEPMQDLQRRAAWRHAQRQLDRTRRELEQTRQRAPDLRREIG